MAENELLDVASAKRWGGTRRELRAGMDPDLVAQRAVEELNRGLRNTLAAANRKGESLESLVRSIGVGRVATREAMLRFNDHTLAQMVVDAFQRLPGCNETSTLAHSVATLIIDRVRDAFVLQSIDTERYRAERERQDLSRALTAQLECFRSDLSLLLRESLQGNHTKKALRPRISRASKQQRVRAVLDESLVLPTLSRSHAQQRH